MEEAVEEGAPLVHEDFGTNRLSPGTWTVGDIEDAFSKADVTVKERYIQQRLIPNAIETRGPWSRIPIRSAAGSRLHLDPDPPHHSRPCSPPTADSRNSACGSWRLTWAGASAPSSTSTPRRSWPSFSRAGSGVPIKWVEDRSENYLATIHGRGQVQDIELAADERGQDPRHEGEATRRHGRLSAAQHAPVSRCSARSCTAASTPSPPTRSSVPASSPTRHPTDAYRGAGGPRPPSPSSASWTPSPREIGHRPCRGQAPQLLRALRRADRHAGRHPVRLDELPAGAGPGAGAGRLRGACGRNRRRRREAGDPVQLGIGFSTYTEICGLAPSQVLSALVRRRRRLGDGEGPDARLGQGRGRHGHLAPRTGTRHQLVPDRRRCPWASRRTTSRSCTATRRSAPYGRDTYGSRSLPVGGVAVHVAAKKVVEKAKKIAAHMLEAAEDDIEFEGGTLQRRRLARPERHHDRGRGAAYLAHNLPEGMEPGLTEDYFFDPPNFTFPFGAHICVVEVDTETGFVRSRDYFGVDDCGPVINPTIVDGQLHGGIAQGVAQALYEEAVYDEEGNLTTGSMVDYLIPGAPELPNYTLERTVTPSPSEPDGREGRRRGRDHRLAARGHKRRRGRALALRDKAHRHAGLAVEGVAGHPGRQGREAGTRDADRSGRPSQAATAPTRKEGAS